MLETAPDGKPMFTARTVEDLHAFLAEHHTRTEGLWLARYRAGTSEPALEYGLAVEELLCWGWVDSTSGSLPDERSLLWISPRRRGSGWSATNKERIERLEAAGRLQPAGRAVIEHAKETGAWTKLDASERGELPPDLVAALAAMPEADAHFAAFPPGVRKAITQWIESAKRPATRHGRVLETVALAAHDIRANQWPRERPTDAQLAAAEAALAAAGISAPS